jgi:L-lactate dehydrogenase complex protein LldF
VVGIDKVVPDWESLTVLLNLLARSATGQKLSAYTSFITGPRREEAENGPQEFHLVLLDNGRSRVLQDPVGRETLKCIRCGCCLNVCPVYKNVGGYAYGWFISGPIGAIFSPQILGVAAARELPFASSLCGACADVCPVKIPIPDILLHLRRRVAEGDGFAPPTAPVVLRIGAKLGRLAPGDALALLTGPDFYPLFRVLAEQDGWLHMLPPPVNRWTKSTAFACLLRALRQWWGKRQEQGSRGEGIRRFVCLHLSIQANKKD